MGARHRIAELWDRHVDAWLRGSDPLDEPLGAWFRSYSGTGDGSPSRDGFVEPWIGDLTADGHTPRLAVLGLNPGRYFPDLQSRSGDFAEEIRRAGSYRQWASSAPYLRDPWVSRYGRNGYYVDRLRFVGRWVGVDRPVPNDMLVVELYPWHSTTVNAPMRPPAAVIDEYVWGPLSELDLPDVFAFGRPWDTVARSLGLTLQESLGHGGSDYGSSVPSRAVRVYELPSGQRLVVEWHSGSAGPPSTPETALLREALTRSGHRPARPGSAVVEDAPADVLEARSRGDVTNGTTAPALWNQVPRLLADNRYCVLATADAEGTPWATPVFFAAHGEDELFWVSSADSRHSRNVAVRPDVAITVFDSTVPVGGAEALYLTARAGVSDDVERALTVLNAGVPDAKALGPADLVPAGPLTVYRATVLRHEVLVRGGDPSFDNVVDGRREVRRPD